LFKTFKRTLFFSPLPRILRIERFLQQEPCRILIRFSYWLIHPMFAPPLANGDAVEEKEPEATDTPEEAIEKSYKALRAENVA
jgi:hypothetical protein